MSYLQNGDGDGSLYIGTVKWNDDYKNIMLFNSKNERDNFFKSHLKQIVKKGIIALNPTGFIDIDLKIKNVEKYNYIFYKNDSDISDTAYCCFIKSFEYIAPSTTRLYVDIDVFQMFFYDTQFYMSYIERATVKKSSDIAGNYTQNEPFSANPESQNLITNILTENDWLPHWVLHKASYYDPESKSYQYGGIETANTFGEYGEFIDNKSDLEDILETYGRITLEQLQERIGDMGVPGLLNGMFKDLLGFLKPQDYDSFNILNSLISMADLQDHRDELIGIYAIPEWLYQEGHDISTDPTDHATNRRSTKTISINLYRNTLANGYTPRNKKMLTSICRCYVLANRTGLRIPFKPELFTSNSTTLTLSGIAMGTNGYQYSLSNYSDVSTAFGECGYNCERRVGYDNNTGLNKVLNTIGASMQLIKGGMELASVADGNIMGIGSAIQSGVSAIDMVGTQYSGFGTNTDLLSITGDRARLRFYEFDPLIDDCQALDNFFDMYGYTINKHYNPVSKTNNINIYSRSNWNYIKSDVNCNCNCPTDFENKFKTIFSSGCTFWHNYNTFGDYTQENN